MNLGVAEQQKGLASVRRSPFYGQAERLTSRSEWKGFWRGSAGLCSRSCSCSLPFRWYRSSSHSFTNQGSETKGTGGSTCKQKVHMGLLNVKTWTNMVLFLCLSFRIHVSGKKASQNVTFLKLFLFQCRMQSGVCVCVCNLVFLKGRNVCHACLQLAGRLRMWC